MSSQWRPSAWLTRWTPPVLPIDLLLKDTCCLAEEILVAGRLVYFLPFWEIIQADCLVLEIIRHGYSIELIRPPKFLGVGNTTNPPRRTASTVQRGGGPPTEGHNSTGSPRQVRSGYYSPYFLVPKKEGSHRPILNLKFFNLNVCKTSFKVETVLHHSHHAPTPVVGQCGSQGRVLPCTSGDPTPPVPLILLAEHQLPIWCTTVWPVIGPPSLHKDFGSSY